MTHACDCLCKPCPKGTILCPTNDECLSYDKWCDGIQHCPDDEDESCKSSTPLTGE